MNYCNDCQHITEEIFCPFCANEKLRQVAKNDFCFITEKEIMWAEMFMEILKDNNIPCAHLSALGAGVAIKTGAIERYKIFVPYGKMNEAMDLLEIAFAE